MGQKSVTKAGWALAVGLLATAWPAVALADGMESSFQDALKSGSVGLAVGLVFLAGVATSLTPCVYPMIAITVSVFGARQTKSRLEGAMLSTAFVLGIAALFTPLGLFAAMTGGVFGSVLASPIVLVGLALLFTALAASMFGAFDLDLPAGLKNKLATAGGGGLKGAFVLGLVSALIAAPCTGPVLGFLLTWVGQSGEVALGALYLFVYALGLGLLFWVVGTFAVSLPKSGQWVEWTKSVFGIAMLVAALYYVRDLMPAVWALAGHTETVLIGSVAMLVVGLGVGAIHLSFHDARGIQIRKGLGVALSVIGVVGLIGYSTTLAPLPPGSTIAWSEDFEHAKALAQSAGKPLLVDFGASWCGACGELERHTFSDNRVVQESQRFVTVRVDLSPGKDTDDNRAALASYDQRGLPLVVMHASDGSEVSRVTGFVEADEFLEMLKRVN